MSPLWPDFAIARAAWDDAVDKGLVDRSDRFESDRRAEPRTPWSGRALREAVRRPIRRRVTSYAL